MKSQNGFTLIELLLYVSILAVILLTVSGFLFVILQSQAKNQTIAEVEQQGAFIMQLVTQSTRNATAINSPADGASAATLSINTTTAANNPTVFDLASGVLRVKEGSAAVVPLTNSRVTVSNLTFTNLEGAIRIQFTLAAVNPGGRNEFNYSQNFYGSAEVRP